MATSVEMIICKLLSKVQYKVVRFHTALDFSTPSRHICSYKIFNIMISFNRLILCLIENWLSGLCNLWNLLNHIHRENFMYWWQNNNLIFNRFKQLLSDSTPDYHGYDYKNNLLQKVHVIKDILVPKLTGIDVKQIFHKPQTRLCTRGYHHDGKVKYFFCHV